MFPFLGLWMLNNSQSGFGVVDLGLSLYIRSCIRLTSLRRRDFAYWWCYCLQLYAMAEDELIELKFRLADGSDIGPNKYNSTATVASLKEKIVAQWPKGINNTPKSINDIKLINAGRILENNKTLAESRLPLSEVPGGVITMHVVVQQQITGRNCDKSNEDSQKKGRCFCSVL